jgi:anti-sigma regulatory factor (Ser/Thr protein kinase)
MITMAPPRPAERHERRERRERHERHERQERHAYRVRLATGPAAAAEARRRVRDAIRSWQVPVDQDAALLLTSELVTNAVRHEAGQAVMLVIGCARGRLRVDVHDTSRSLPVVAQVPADAETGRGLLLVETLSEQWGFYRTPTGKAVYFTLVFQPDQPDQPDQAPAAGGRDPQRVHARGRWTVTPPSAHRPRRAALAVPAARLPSA